MRSIFTKLGEERGQMLVLIALLTTAILGVVGLAVDTGFLFAERRQLQNAADHAALAAAYELNAGGDTADAVAIALAYAAENGYDNDGTTNTVTVSIPPVSGEHIGDDEYAEVAIQRSANTFFIQAILQNLNEIGARGVAGGAGIPNYAIFVGPSCGGDADGEGEIEGDDILINGAVYAADLEIDGNNAVVTGSVTWLCEMDLGSNDWTFGSGPTQLSAEPAIPVDSSLLSYAHYEPFCTFTFAGNIDIDEDTPQYWQNNDPDTDTLKPGVYCAPNGEIEIHGGGNGSVYGNVTFVSHDEIELHSDVDNFSFTAFLDGVLAFTDGGISGDDEGEIEFEAHHGDVGEWTGMLLAPNGEIELEGDNLYSPSTLIFAGEELEIEGDNIDITAMDLGTYSGPALVE